MYRTIWYTYMCGFLHEYVIKYVALIVPSKFASGYMDDYNGYADDYDDARDFGDARDDDYYDDYF